MRSQINDLPVYLVANVIMVSGELWDRDVADFLGEHLTHTLMLERRDGEKVVLFPALGRNYFEVFNALMETGHSPYGEIADLMEKPVNFLIGSHQCDTSWYGRCVYDVKNDGALDHCVFCGYPDERK